MKKITPFQFDLLQQELEVHLGSYWNFQVVKKTDPNNAFDPPFKYLKAQVQGLIVIVTDGGEVYVDDEYEAVDLGSGWMKRVIDTVMELLQDGEVSD